MWQHAALVSTQGRAEPPEQTQRRQNSDDLQEGHRKGRDHQILESFAAFAEYFHEAPVHVDVLGPGFAANVAQGGGDAAFGDVDLVAAGERHEASFVEFYSTGARFRLIPVPGRVCAAPVLKRVDSTTAETDVAVVQLRPVVKQQQQQPRWLLESTRFISRSFLYLLNTSF